MMRASQRCLDNCLYDLLESQRLRRHREVPNNRGKKGRNHPTLPSIIMLPNRKPTDANTLPPIGLMPQDTHRLCGAPNPSKTPLSSVVSLLSVSHLDDLSGDETGRGGATEE